MINENKHIIHKLTFDVLTNDRNVGQNYKDNAARNIQNILLPLLDKKLEESFPSLREEFLTIENLTLDISISQNDNWNSTIADQIVKDVKEQLVLPKNKSAIQRHGRQEKSAQVFQYYMIHGHLPWNANPIEFESLWSGSNSNNKPPYSLHLLIGQLHIPNVVERIVSRFTTKEILQFIKDEFISDTILLKQLSTIWETVLFQKTQKYKVAFLLFIFSEEKTDSEALLYFVFQVFYWEVQKNGFTPNALSFLEKCIHGIDPSKVILEKILFQSPNFNYTTLILLAIKEIQSFTKWYRGICIKYSDYLKFNNKYKVTQKEYEEIKTLIAYIQQVKEKEIKKEIEKQIETIKGKSNLLAKPIKTDPNLLSKAIIKLDNNISIENSIKSSLSKNNQNDENLEYITELKKTKTNPKKDKLEEFNSPIKTPKIKDILKQSNLETIKENSAQDFKDDLSDKDEVKLIENRKETLHDSKTNDINKEIKQNVFKEEVEGENSLLNDSNLDSFTDSNLESDNSNTLKENNEEELKEKKSKKNKKDIEGKKANDINKVPINLIKDLKKDSLLKDEINNTEENISLRLLRNEEASFNENEAKNPKINSELDVSQTIQEKTSLKENSLTKKETNLDFETNNMSGSDTLNKEQKITEQEEKLESKEIIKQKFEKFQLAMDSLEKEVFSTKDFSAKASSYLVHHAGIVILNPYFSPFLKNCELVTEEGKLNNPSLAVQVINYLATGKENRNEEQMVFEKFICDYPIESPLYFQSIPEDLKQKCDELLENIIQNWDTLKSSSIDLLRNEFLQRPGKIELDKEFPIVRLERKTQDILVDRIPWNLSIIKLPWKKKMFHTIW